MTSKECFFIVLLCFFKIAFATTLVVPPDGDIVGDVEYTHAQMGETLGEIGVRYDIGYYEMVNANPHINPMMPVPSKISVLIPSQFILPRGIRHGLVINLAEYRLYFFPENDNVVITNPVGIGRNGWSTPLGVTHIVAKQVNPTWRPTENVRADAAKNGMPIPDVFPPGLGNPLGKHVLRLGWPTYLIHGTNRTDGIGERVSAGCIRMLPVDIEFLFGFVKIGATVRVVNEPVKFGKLNGHLYIEVHPSLLEQKKQSLNSQIEIQLGQQTRGVLNRAIINQEAIHPSGVPKKVAT